MTSNAGGFESGLCRRFQYLAPERSIRIHSGYPNLPCRRCTLLSNPRYAELFFLLQAGERNHVAGFEHAVDTLQQGSAPADIDRHHSLIQWTAADVVPTEQHGQCQINSRVSAIPKSLRA